MRRGSFRIIDSQLILVNDVLHRAAIFVLMPTGKIKRVCNALLNNVEL